MSRLAVDRQINVVREVVDISDTTLGFPSKNPYIGNYPVDIEYPKNGDTIVFKDGAWVKTTSNLVNILDNLPSKYSVGKLYYITSDQTLYLGISEDKAVTVGKSDGI